MATEFKRMMQRGSTEAALLEENQVPQPREIVVATDTGAFWVGSDAGDALKDLPKQGPITVDPVTAMAVLQDGTAVPTIDPETQQLPGAVRSALALNLTDPSTPEGAALAAALEDTGAGSKPALVFDSTSGLFTLPAGGTALKYDPASGLYTTN